MRGLKRPAFVYFDLGNVLLKFDHEIACAQISELTAIDAARVRALIFDNDLQEKYEMGLVSTAEFYQFFCQETGTDSRQDNLMLAASDIFTLNAPIVPIVVQLKSQGVPLGILSNTCEAHWEFINHGRFELLKQFFSVIALSYELKSMKPQPKIYQEAAKLSGFAPEQIFFLDDREENVAGARACGFDAILYESPAKLAFELEGRGFSLNY